MRVRAPSPPRPLGKASESNTNHGKQQQHQQQCVLSNLICHAVRLFWLRDVACDVFETFFCIISLSFSAPSSYALPPQFCVRRYSFIKALLKISLVSVPQFSK